MKLGILGGGQLGAMLAERAISLGHEVIVVHPTAECSAAHVTTVSVASFDDPQEVQKAMQGVDALTLEFENIPLPLVESLKTEFSVYPPSLALYTTQHRAREKSCATRCGIPTPDYTLVRGTSELLRALRKLSVRAVVKSCSDGYDGKGQWRFDPAKPISEFESTFSERSDENEYVIESFVAFEREVSCIAVRSQSGEVRFYDVCENLHRSGVLFRTLAPSEHVTEEVTSLACRYTAALLEELQYVGVLSVEFFMMSDGTLLFNEFAPRVHNSGHWTIEGAACSQFENHVRACLDLPLGDTTATGYSVMCNLLGTVGRTDEIENNDAVFYHWYNKSVKPGRKVGHVTAVCPSSEERARLIESIERAVS